ncbi:MAG: tripartite tricarboxylate transporter permease [Candidatus Heteroscillospira sp.]|jgi:putative tricarboxylic transport membrane protein
MELFILGLAKLCNPLCMGLIFGGVVVGIIFGSMPGLSATMAIALFLPITYGMEAIPSFALMMGLYIGAVSGGLITAILIRIPGTPSSVATCWDGHPMVQKGEGMKALGSGIVFSFLGTILSILALVFIAPTLAKIATSFGFFEYFAVSFFSLTMISTLASGSMIKGLFSGVLGFMFSTVGIAPIDATVRFTFGQKSLMGGFSTLPVLIGLFAVSELLNAAQQAKFDNGFTITPPNTRGVKGFGFSMKEFRGQLPNFFRSSLIGIGIGILPGIGGGTSNILSYVVAKNRSKTPELFGTGIIDGVVASESANNASIGGAMIPLLTLGIPGDACTAILLGGFTLHELTPGPLLFEKHADLVYSIFAAMVIASVIMILVEFYGLRLFVKVLAIPKHIMLAVVFTLCAVGAYGNSSRVFDIGAVLLFGVVGYMFTCFKIPTAPFILGFILGRTAETYLRRGLMLSKGDWSPFITKPISCAFIILSIGVIVFTAYRELHGYYSKRKKSV